MTRKSLERLKNRSSTDPSSHEMGSQPIPRLSMNEWRTSADERRAAPDHENPFQDPSTIHRTSVDHGGINQDPIHHPQTAHTHHDYQEHHDTSPIFRTVDIEHGIPKALGTPSITALPLHLPHHPSKIEHPQKFHRIFLSTRLVIQVLLFVLALIGFLLKYPKTITYTGMLTGNSLAFVLVWAVLVVLVYFTNSKMRMSRYSSQPEQWRKCVSMVVFDGMIVFVWLLVCWGNTGLSAPFLSPPLHLSASFVL